MSNPINMTGASEILSDNELLERSPTALPSEWNYEATVIKIEGIVAQIESGKLELDQVFDEFTNAVEYLRQCEMFLSRRQQQMDLLIETLMDESNTQNG